MYKSLPIIWHKIPLSRRKLIQSYCFFLPTTNEQVHRQILSGMRARDCFAKCFSVVKVDETPRSPHKQPKRQQTPPPPASDLTAASTSTAEAAATAETANSQRPDTDSNSSTTSSSASSSQSSTSTTSSSRPPTSSTAAADNRHLPASLRRYPEHKLWRILATMLAEPPRRRRLTTVSTLTAVVQLLRQSRNILVLTGAGVSVSCGIPDFRSSGGVYARLRAEYPDLPDPQAMFNIRYFAQDPRPFYRFAREIFPGQFVPSASHRFIRLLELGGRLLRNYTQNIDTLERVVGIERVIECHGSFATASCTRCQRRVRCEEIRADILAQRIPMCTVCCAGGAGAIAIADVVRPGELVGRGVMKPDIVFFGESLPDEFNVMIEVDKRRADLVIVIGSSLKVNPVALIPSSVPAGVPQVLINREQLETYEFDVELLGDSDVVIGQLCHM